MHVIRLLGEICDGIHDLIKNSGICEVIYLDFVSQQAQASLYTWQSTQKLIAGILCAIERVQLPKRDRETILDGVHRMLHGVHRILDGVCIILDGVL